MLYNLYLLIFGVILVSHFLLIRETWSKPQKVEGLKEVRVQAAFASGVISAAIGDDGALWVWGKSKRGQLGLGENITDAVSPARVEALIGHKIVKVVFV